MSMTMLTILQIAQALGSYTLVTLILPGIVLHKRLAGYRMSERLIGYFLAGNFYIMYLVFLLQFLHISYPITLQVGTLSPFIPMIWKNRKKIGVHIVSNVNPFFQTVMRLLRKEVGVKTLAAMKLKKFQGKYSNRIKSWTIRYLPDILLTTAIIIGVFYVYGTNTVTVFGYKASDVPVHNLWINEMDNNNIFAKGVYPHGFHCMIYYLHAVFGIKTYILLRVFCIVQTLFIHLMLLLSLQVICRVRFSPYIGTAAYLMLNIYNDNAMARYSSTLPQEYGMLFIFPAGVLAIRFFQEYAAFRLESSEIQKKQRKQNVLDYLIGFAVSFSLTLTVHFYNTMPTGVLCLGIAIGFSFRFCRWRYFWRIILTGLISILLAVLPMAIGVLTGHQLQGSLYWGLNVINGTANNNTDEQEAITIIDKNGNEIKVVGEVDSEVLENIINGGNTIEDSESLDETQVELTKTQEEYNQESTKQSPITSLLSEGKIILNQIQVYCTNASRTVTLIMVGAIVALILLGVIAIVLRKNDYAGMILSVDFYMLFMCVMQALTALGLPELMQPSRLCIFFCYSLGLVWALNVDAFIYLVFGWLKKNWVMNGISGIILAIGTIVSVVLGLVRLPVTANALETNEAIICLTNIIHENKPFNWTILSANDEHQMIIDSGRHYEMITFLRQLMDLKRNSEIKLPTEYVYFFIEKQPINYAHSADGIELKLVSEDGANTPINTEKGISAYTGEARWGTMSHMYYWAQAFKKLYPNEMEVYYETDDFVCYRLHQNVESLYNLAIDYGYNNPKTQEEE